MATIDLTDSAHLYDFRLMEGNNRRFWPRWGPFSRGMWVLATYDGSWTITTYPGTKSIKVDDQAAATYSWLAGGSHTFEDESGLVEALVAAGYNAGSGFYVDGYTDIY